MLLKRHDLDPPQNQAPRCHLLPSLLEVGTLTCEALTLQAVLSNAPQMSCLDPSHNEGVCDQSLARRIEQHETLGREEIPARTGALWARMTQLGVS